MTRHDIDILLDAAAAGDRITLPEGWGQGRATFGGVVAGAMLARGIAAIGAEASTLRSMTTNFLAPATPGDAEITAEVLRQGKSATQVEVRLRQPEADGGPGVRAVALLTFGARRSSAVEVSPSGPGEVPDPDSLERIPVIPGMTPDFIAHIDMRVATGSFPFSGATSGDLTGAMRFREPTADFGLPHLVTLVDSWPPAPLQMLSAPAPASTMTWTIELLTDVEASGTDHWWYEVVTDAAHDGYGHTHARIYDVAGRLVAISRQTVAVFG